MKKAVILTLMYAILFSMAVASFSLYTTSVPVASTVIGTKVFDVSKTPADSIADLQNLESSSSWMFMALNSDTANTYDTNISITLNTAATDDKLGVSVYANTNPSTALVSGTFAANSKTLLLTISKQFLQGVSSPISMTLKYTYNGSPLSSSNKPSGLGSVLQTTVTVGGTINNTRTDAEIIANILRNPWCSMNIVSFNKNKANASSYLSIVPITSADTQIDMSGEIQIYMTKSGTDYTFIADYITPYRTRNIMIQTMTISNFSPPNAVVLNCANFTGDQSITISNVKLSQTASGTGSYFGNPADQSVLLTNLPVDANGCFDVSFDYLLEGTFKPGSTANSKFSINFGYK